MLCPPACLLAAPLLPRLPAFAALQRCVNARDLCALALAAPLRCESCPAVHAACQCGRASRMTSRVLSCLRASLASPLRCAPSACPRPRMSIAACPQCSIKSAPQQRPPLPLQPLLLRLQQSAQLPWRPARSLLAACLHLHHSSSAHCSCCAHSLARSPACSS